MTVFDDWAPEARPRLVGERAIRDFLARPLRMARPERGAGRYERFHYAEGLTGLGALRLLERPGVAAASESDAESDAEIRAALMAKLGAYFSPDEGYLPDGPHVDERVFGAMALELARATGAARPREVGLRLADAQWQQTTDDGITREARYWIDDMYMITVLQLQAYRATAEREYLDRAARTMVSYLERLQQPGGLFFHTLESPVYWGRGNGWVAAGLAELASELSSDHPLRPAVLGGYRRMLDALLRWQRDDGSWGQVVDDPASWREGSCTAMFAFALACGVGRGWLEGERWQAAARRAWLATTSFVDERGRMRQVCVGAGHASHVVGSDPGAQHRYYLGLSTETGDLHGQAPLLWAAAALASEP